ncbi:hypothetical protein [Thalassobellus citreus]|uniref:hypothetical protein n=1 Tax=Thalassobellus citreus TaxID=3367752 RepID=UPI0037B01741
MKSIFKIIVLILIISISNSCSSNDGESTDENTPNRYYKKSLLFQNDQQTGETEVFYNDNKQVTSIVKTYFESNTITFNVSYSKNIISSINEVNTHYSGNVVSSSTLNVTYKENIIILKYKDINTMFEIYHSNGYVDRLNAFDTSTGTNSLIQENVFTRNSNENLISYLSSNGRLIEYSNFDSGKMENPSNEVLMLSYGHFYRIFNLKTSKNNPQTSIFTFLNPPSSGTINNLFEYDDLNYVIKTSYSDVSNTIPEYTLHEYIEF